LEVGEMVRIKKTVAEKWLADVVSEKYFWCSDGRVLKNLPELEVALKEISEETFHYHSNEFKNDFSNWVHDVVGDEKLARDLRKNTTQIQAAKSLADRIAWLKGK
jgi:hypothetical protein